MPAFDHKLFASAIAAMSAAGLTDSTIFTPAGAEWRIIDPTDPRAGNWVVEATARSMVINLVDATRPESTCLFPTTDPKRPELFILAPSSDDELDVILTMFLAWAGLVVDRHSQEGGVSFVSYGGLATRIEPIAGRLLRARLAGAPIDGKLAPAAPPDQWRGRMLPAIRNICDYRLVATGKTIHRWSDPLLLVDGPTLVVYSKDEDEKSWTEYLSRPVVPIEPVDLTKRPACKPMRRAQRASPAKRAAAVVKSPT